MPTTDPTPPTNCVCGHSPRHHDRRKSVYAGLMADYRVVWACGWTGCGCPNYVRVTEGADDAC